MCAPNLQKKKKATSANPEKRHASTAISFSAEKSFSIRQSHEFILFFLIVTIAIISNESRVLHQRVDEALKKYDFSGRLRLLGEDAEQFIPNSIAELSAFISKCAHEGKRVRVVGGANSYSPIIQSADRGALVSLFHLDRLLDVDIEKKQVTLQAGIRERDLHDIVSEYGWSLPQVTRKFNVLAGGLNSGHHSSGYDIPEVTSAIVVGMEIMNGLGEVITANPGDDLFYAGLVGLGRAGIVVEYTLQCVEKFLFEGCWRTV